MGFILTLLSLGAFLAGNQIGVTVLMVIGALAVYGAGFLTIYLAQWIMYSIVISTLWGTSFMWLALVGVVMLAISFVIFGYGIALKIKNS